MKLQEKSYPSASITLNLYTWPAYWILMSWLQLLVEQLLGIGLPFAASFLLPSSCKLKVLSYWFIDAYFPEWHVDKFLLRDNKKVGRILYIKVTENTWGRGKEQEDLQNRPGHPRWGIYCSVLSSSRVEYSDLMLVLILFMKIMYLFSDIY